MAQVIPLVMAGIQISQQQAQASIAVGESKVAAEQEDLGAKQREADRKERLSIALASQNSSAGARGIAAFEGSPLTILKEDIHRESIATKRDVFSSKLASLTAKTRGLVQAKSLRSKSLLTAGSAALSIVEDK